MRAPDRDNVVVGVLASLPDAALFTSGVLEAQVGATAAGTVMPAAVHDAVVWMVKQHGGGVLQWTARASQRTGSKTVRILHVQALLSLHSLGSVEGK